MRTRCCVLLHSSRKVSTATPSEYICERDIPSIPILISPSLPSLAGLDSASALGALWVLGGVTLLARTPRVLDGDLDFGGDFDFDGDYASPRALSGFRPSARGALWVLGGSHLARTDTSLGRPATSTSASTSTPTTALQRAALGVQAHRHLALAPLRSFAVWSASLVEHLSSSSRLLDDGPAFDDDSDSDCNWPAYLAYTNINIAFDSACSASVVQVQDHSVQSSPVRT
ncbi:hypothetical protein EV122DRAFT_272677 [Schizophyllum commune]